MKSTSLILHEILPYLSIRSILWKIRQLVPEVWMEPPRRDSMTVCVHANDIVERYKAPEWRFRSC